MDLDNLKKDWQATKLDVRVDDDKIRQMLDNKGKSAFEKLLKVEKFSFKAGIVCFLFPVLFSFIYSPGVGISYAVFLGLCMIWQKAMMKILQGIDVTQMNIMEISISINRYKKKLNKSIIWGGIIAVIWLLYASLSYADHVHLRPYNADTSFMSIASRMFLISLFFAVVLCYAIYSRYYFKNIREIERSIKEVEEYQKDNIN